MIEPTFTLEQLLSQTDARRLPSLDARSAQDIAINHITLNSSLAHAGSLFVAAKGATPKSRDGHDFIEAAVQNGASAVLLQNWAQSFAHLSVPVFVCANAKKTAAHLCEKLQGFPGQKLGLVGITGTNGKTTVAFLSSFISEAMGFRAGIMGTLGTGARDNLSYNGFTTLSQETLSAELSRLLALGFSQVSMEVSSHALSQYRADGLLFRVAALTNITPEHLDFHGNMAEYRAAKERLFLELLAQDGIAVLPHDDVLVQKCRAKGIATLTYAKSDAAADVALLSASCTASGTTVRMHLQDHVIEFQSTLVGDFNVENLLCAATIGKALGASADEIVRALTKAHAPPARLERVEGPVQAPLVFVDFAHTPDALEKVLQTLAQLPQQKLRVVFGCGGDRDTQKRPKMGEIAARWADDVFITTDNPRSEDPKAIIDAILRGIKPSDRNRVHVELDRALAIQEAILTASQDTVVLIAGKGDERTLEVKGTFVPFHDRTLAEDTLRKMAL